MHSRGYFGGILSNTRLQKAEVQIQIGCLPPEPDVVLER